MMTMNIRTIALATSMLAAGGTAVAADTLGEKLASGELTRGGFVQLISGTGLSEAEARQATLEDIVEIKWQDDD